MGCQSPGVVLLVLGVKESKSSEHDYVCGSPPTQSEMGDLPVCLDIITTHEQFFPPSPERPLCLRGGTNVNDPPLWCYKNVKDTELNCGGDNDCGGSDFWLYWSPCEDCGGTAWRMYNERDDDESWYKVLSGPTSLPPEGEDAGWMRWTAYGDQGSWEDTVINFIPCGPNDPSLNLRGSNYTIPSECYDEISRYDEDSPMPVIFYVGLGLVIAPTAISCLVFFYILDRDGYCKGGGYSGGGLGGYDGGVATEVEEAGVDGTNHASLFSYKI